MGKIRRIVILKPKKRNFTHLLMDFLGWLTAGESSSIPKLKINLGNEHKSDSLKIKVTNDNDVSQADKNKAAKVSAGGGQQRQPQQQLPLDLTDKIVQKDKSQLAGGGSTSSRVTFSPESSPDHKPNFGSFLDSKNEEIGLADDTFHDVMKVHHSFYRLTFFLTCFQN